MPSLNLETKLNELDLYFDKTFFSRCDKFIDLLQEWGAVHNLTSSLTRLQIINNIIDSIYPLKFLSTFNSFADIGTGAGYPGMILAIAKPNTKAVLIEPKAKRVAFLNFVKNALKLSNVEIIHKRAQDISPSSYDLITSRAVTNTSLLLCITQNLSNQNTEFLFYKGSICQEEIEKAKINKVQVISVGENRNYLYMKRKGLFDDI